MTSDLMSADTAGHVSQLKSQCSEKMESLMLAWQHIEMSMEPLSSDDFRQLSSLVSDMSNFLTHALNHV